MRSPECFYLHIQGEQRGPYTIPQIDHLLNSGLIAEETLYWREGLEQWEPVTSLVKLRKKTNPWIKPLIVVVILLVLVVLGEFFGSIALIGWRETNQHRYSAHAAYWRARGVIRSEALPRSAVVEFEHFSTAHVEMTPPAKATVSVKGELIDQSGMAKPMAWRVPMNFDPQAQEWNGGKVEEVTP